MTSDNVCAPVNGSPAKESAPEPGSCDDPPTADGVEAVVVDAGTLLPSGATLVDVVGAVVVVVMIVVVVVVVVLVVVGVVIRVVDVVVVVPPG